MTTYEIKDAGDLRKYFTQVPNLLDDSGLSLIAFRLYFHLKRVAGENGNCHQSGENLAKACCMSTGAISKAKKELEEAGFIRVEIQKDQTHSWHVITINDIWNKNIQYYSVSRSEEKIVVSPSPSETPPSPDETKNNSLINNNITNPLPKKEVDYTSIKITLFQRAKALAQVTGMDFEKNKGRLFREAKSYKPDEVGKIIEAYGIGGNWYTKDWRGKRGERPSLSNIRETWDQYTAPSYPPLVKYKQVEHIIDGERFIERVPE